MGFDPTLYPDLAGAPTMGALPHNPTPDFNSVNSPVSPPSTGIDHSLYPDLAPKNYEPLPPLPEPEKDDEGLLGKIGYVLDTPGSLLRGLLAGEPFHRASGQHLLKNWGLIDDDQQPLFSGAGAAGLAAELAFDPLNFLPGFAGVNALTKEGKAAELIGGHLGEAANAVGDYVRTEQRAARATEVANQAAREFSTFAPKANPLSHPLYGNLLDEAGQAVGPRAIVERLAARKGTPLGEAAAKVLGNKAAVGFGDRALTVLPEAADRVNAGQQALFSVGGEYDPFSLFRFGGQYNPVNYLPKIPVLTAPLELPQYTLLKAPEESQALQNAWRAAKAAPPLPQLAELFSKIPNKSKISEKTAEILGKIHDQFFTDISKGEAAAGERAAELDNILKQPAPPKPPTIENLPPKLWPTERDAELEARAQQFYKDEELHKALPEIDAGQKAAQRELAKARAVQGAVPGDELPELPELFSMSGTGGERLLKEGEFDPLGLGRASEKMEAPLQAAREAQIGLNAVNPLEDLKFGGIPGLPRLDKAVPELVEPKLEDFLKPDVGHNVQFWNKDQLGGANGRAQQVTGKIFAFNEDSKTFSIRTNNGDQYVVPESKVSRTSKSINNEFYAAKAEYDAAQARKDIQTVPLERRGLVRDQASDAKNLLAANAGIPYGEDMAANAAAKTARAKQLDLLGLNDTATDQAKALPKALEEYLPKLQPGETLPARSVEFLPRGAEDLGIGDQISIGGDTFKFEGISPEGKAKFKDGYPVQYPFDHIPIDRGTQILRNEAEHGLPAIEDLFGGLEHEPAGGGAGEGAVPSARVADGPAGSTAAIEPGARPDELLSQPEGPKKFERLNRAADVLADTEKRLGVEPSPLHDLGEGGEIKASLTPDEDGVLNARIGNSQFRMNTATKLLPIEQHIKNVADALGIETHFVEQIPGGAKGLHHFDPAIDRGSGGRLFLQAKQQSGDLVHVFGHELTHHAIKSLGPDVAPIFLEAARDVLGEKYQPLMDSIAKRYAQQGFKLTPQAALEEIVADAGGSLMKGDGLEWISKAAQQNPGILDQIVERIKNAISQVTRFIDHVSPAERKPLEEMVDRLHKLTYGLQSGDEALSAGIRDDILGMRGPSPSRRLNYLLGGDAGNELAAAARETDTGAQRAAASFDPLGLGKASIEPGEDLVPFSKAEGEAAQAKMDKLREELKDKGLSDGEVEQKLERYRAAQSTKFAEKSREKAAEYLNLAGAGTQAAAEGAHAAIPPDASPDFAKRVTDLLEHGGAEHPDVVEVAKGIRERYKEMLDVERKMGMPSPELKSPHLEYTTHASTPDGHAFFQRVAKNKKMQGELFMALEQSRLGKGVPGNPAAGKPGFQQRMDAAMKTAPAASKNVPAALDKLASSRAFEGLSNDAKRFILDNNLQRDFQDFSREISASHGSQVPRLEAYKHLGVSELNEVFSKFGARGPVFSENPAAQLFTREVRHVKATAAQALLDRAGEQLGHEVPENLIGASWPVNGDESIVKHGDKSYGVTVLNKQREARGLGPIGFDDPDTARAVRDTYNKLTTPEEVGPLLQWYDNATRVMKSYVTRLFPAHHVSNHIGNRIQSWLGGVPVAGEHYENAFKMLAGKDFEVTLGDGTKATRDSLAREVKSLRVDNGGFYDELLERGLKKEKPHTFNPLDPDNVFIQAGSKVGEAIASGPGMLLNGGGLKDLTDGVSERADRIGHYVYRRMQGMAPEAARADVDKFLFDYSKKNLSPFEQKYARRAFFSYGYTRNVIPMVMEAAMSNLSRVHQITQLGQQPGRPDFIPSWARTGLPLPIAHDDKGNTSLAYNLHTPVEAAAEPFAGFADGLPRGIEQLLGTLNPMLKVPLELGSGKDFFLDKDIVDATKAPHYVEGLPKDLKDLLGVHESTRKDGSVKTDMDPYALYALRNSPLSRLSSTASRLADDRKGLPEDLLNLFSGSRVVTVNDEDEKGRAQKQAIRDRLAELAREGRASKFTNYSANGDAEAKGLLKALRKK